MSNHLHFPGRVPIILRLDRVDLRTMPKPAEATGILITAAEGAEKRDGITVKAAGTRERRYVVPALGLGAWQSK